jgi:hypothetical protein
MVWFKKVSSQADLISPHDKSAPPRSSKEIIDLTLFLTKRAPILV